MFPDYKEQFLTPKKHGRLMLCYAQVAVGASGAPTLTAASSSPGVSIVRNSAGQYTVTGPKGALVHPISSTVAGPAGESAGSQGYPEVITPGSGTVSYEFATTPGTAAEVASGSTLLFTWIVGRF